MSPYTVAQFGWLDSRGMVNLQSRTIKLNPEGSMSVANPYATGLDRTLANYTPLSPISLI